jgi:hypothetical protein
MDSRSRSWPEVSPRLVAAALLLASAVAVVVIPEPSWWHVGYPLDAAAANKDGPLAHPAPGVVLPLSLFVLSGLATWRAVWTTRSRWWLLALVCAIAQVPFAAILYDQAAYDSMFGAPPHHAILLFLIYSINGLVVYGAAALFLGMYAYLGARWLGPRLLKLVGLDKWWDRESRTELEFATERDALTVARDWATANGALLVQWEDGRHFYQLRFTNRNGAAVNGLVLRIEQARGQVRLEAGIENASILRLLTFGIIPITLPLSSGRFAGVHARRRGRVLVNQLLGELGGPQIA